ncbi:3-deoxy-7-phosphoheptulonate synthase [Candidatus Chlorohelix sp.]|uniref:3-deoxy-7-phosphoheptulonate synthase n=1 Tax=Candidatus Chlorohelix sp. TaxID=3139201 RepID=UPI003032C7BE
MIVVMKTGTPEHEVQEIIKRIEEQGLIAHPIFGAERTVVGVVGSSFRQDLADMLSSVEAVESVIPVSKKYKLASREFHPVSTTFKVGDVEIGGDAVVVMAGPCSVENEEQIITTARAVKAAGARILRGGAFKPRTSPYQFRGMGEDGLKLLAAARAETGLPVITEVLTPADVELVAQYADILQIGARNMQNFLLLEECGRSNKPVLLKRGISATIEEWLLAAEYILNAGNKEVMLCERGIRGYDTMTRNIFDLSAVPLVKKLSHLPVIADPSHATGKWYLVEPMAMASIACGADGLIIEVHPNPDHALSDGPQSLTLENFAKLMPKVDRIAAATERYVLPRLSQAR